MEVLLLAAATWLVFQGGAQSEQAKLGLTPAHRAALRENRRHEKAVQRIADKYGADAPKTSSQPAGVGPWKEPPAAPTTVTIPQAFWSGYRSHSPIQRVATPLGRRAGSWTARGVAWAKDTGKGALRTYRDRVKASGGPDPAPVVMVPAPPTQPPTAGVNTTGEQPKPGTVPAPRSPDDPDAPDKASEPVVTGPVTPVTAQDTAVTVPDNDDDWRKVYAWIPQDEPTTPVTTVTEPTKPQGGVGRMAAEVTYESVMDESDELSLMCNDDTPVYGRIRERCEREIGRADELIAAMNIAGFGDKPIGRVASCQEQYRVILSGLDELEQNTLAQGEQVVKAKALLEAGQGVYAQIAADMESVAVREAYVSDQVDSEDTNADSEVYETQGA